MGGENLFFLKVHILFYFADFLTLFEILDPKSK